MRIAIFDYRVIPTNPVGGIHRRLLEGLADEHDFVVFAVQFDNPRPDRIRHVRVPVPLRPLALLFVMFHLIAPLCYLWYRVRGGARFDVIQTVESNVLFRSDLIYAQFCHTAFLKHHWHAVRGAGLRAWLRYIDHRLHALLERLAFARAGRIICPSAGLVRELTEAFPFAREKLVHLSNPIATDRLRRPQMFDRTGWRETHGFGQRDIVLVFTALGQFERKGLPLVVEAMQRLGRTDLKLDVVGGETDYVKHWRDRVERLGLGNQVVFRGMQQDLRPHLWGADALVFPSSYETFSLTTYEAAAAGLPLLVSRLHGVEEILRDGVNGFLVERSGEGVARAISQLVALTDEQRRQMGANAQHDAAGYDVNLFHTRWRAVYDRIATERVGGAAAMDGNRL
ncbi:MAG TPA: glycosyltransferase family 4 protein [Tepidisphaeraceae bacterium]|nr:glycosyltransferase family 4 protein [Tepidisphaeraceae bacterium]